MKVNDEKQNVGDLEESKTSEEKKAHSSFPNIIQLILNLGLSEQVARYGTLLVSAFLILLFVYLAKDRFSVVESASENNRLIDSQATSPVSVSQVPVLQSGLGGVAREARLHTNIPDRPRSEIIQYTVAKGDTVIGIAEKFNLKPQTIMFGNYYTIRDDPHNLSIGQVLNILPIDGYYYEWQLGDGLNGVAKGLNVSPEDIINYPLNDLDAATIGDYSNPNIKPGTWLIVPGGTRPYSSWTAPAGVTRDDPATARVMGAGACEAVSGGAIGLGYFVWPADKHFLSGFDYSPETNHRGIDIAGNTGEPVYAVDAGVIVYAGWNDWGYGNMIMIDHGNGWQSLYAHLNSLDVGCGQSVDMNWVIGTIGNTGKSSGSHLHFELMHTQYSKVNPWSYLPPP